MARRVDPLKAKQARQKKLAIGLGVVLVAVVAFQGPKTLKMLKGPAAVAAPAATTPQPASSTPVTGTPAPAGALAASAAPAAVLVDSDVPPATGQDQLQSFELFRSKDPFEQQAEEVSVEAPVSAAPSEAQPKPVDLPTAVTTGGSGSTNGGSALPGATAGAPVGPSPPSVKPPATTTSVAVNGKVEDVLVKGTFPTLEPVFVLVSLGQNGKSVKIGIAGGSYHDGSDTITLELGKPLTLQNTADGSRYELELRAVEGFPLPKP